MDGPDVLSQIADLVPDVRRPLLVGVDGPDGAGKTRVADALAAVLRARGRETVRASTDDFHHPRAHRHALGRTAESVWSRHFDYPAMRRELLDPWLAGAGGAYRRTWHDLARDEPLEVASEEVPLGGVLVVDGVFLQRPELEQVWDLVVFVDAPPEVTVARMAARDGRPSDPDHPDQRRYLDAQRIYFETCGPRQQADLLVDNREFERPRLVELDPVPPGWAEDGDEIVRTLRLPRGAGRLAAAVNRAVPPAR